MIQAVYFDLDNTLVDRSASIDKFAISFMKFFGSKLVDTNVVQVANMIKAIDNGGYLPEDSKYSTIFEAIGENLSSRLNWENKPMPNELSAFWKQIFPQSSVEMAGAKELISNLHRQGYFIGIISNGAHASRKATLASTSFSHLVRQLVSSESFGAAKPNPGIFIHSSRKAGFSPSECMYVGDHPVNDMHGAQLAGMSATLLDGFHPNLVPPKNIQIINELSEVLALLKSP
ncbi:HAD family hydrolase [Vibrio vulnificus]|nr:HAD family hydrolase [Vibrio vulnificus]